MSMFYNELLKKNWDKMKSYIRYFTNGMSYFKWADILIYIQSRMPCRICILNASISIKFACTQVQKIIIWVSFCKREHGICKTYFLLDVNVSFKYDVSSIVRLLKYENQKQSAVKDLKNCILTNTIDVSFFLWIRSGKKLHRFPFIFD